MSAMTSVSVLATVVPPQSHGAGAGSTSAISHIARWLRDYAGVLVAAATIVLVWVTGRYVKLTHTLSREARDQFGEMMKARLDARMPTVGIDVYSQYMSERKIVQMTTTIRNIGLLPADIFLYFPKDWVGESAHLAGVLAVTANPGENQIVPLGAPVNPDALIATSPPFTHRQNLKINFDVRPQAGGVHDRFSWSATFDPADRAHPLDSGYTTALHEGRVYTELDRRDTPLDLFEDENKKKWREKWWNIVSRLPGSNRVTNPKNSTPDESLTREN
jgi:hypothetical protein